MSQTADAVTLIVDIYKALGKQYHTGHMLDSLVEYLEIEEYNSTEPPAAAIHNNIFNAINECAVKIHRIHHTF